MKKKNFLHQVKIKWPQVFIERVGLAVIIETAEKSGLVNLSEILQYWIAEESLSVFNANGTFRKVQKSKLIQKLSLLPVDPRLYVAIVDMGMIRWMSTANGEDREKANATFYSWGILPISLFLDVS